MKYDYLVVGAGLFGAAFAQMAKEKGKRVLVIDKRNHIAGNIYTEDVGGIAVHRYGAHIFHTDDEEVWQYANPLRHVQPLHKRAAGKIPRSLVPHALQHEHVLCHVGRDEAE